VVLFIISWKLTLITVAGVAPIGVITALYSAKIRVLQFNIQKTKGELGDISEEALTNIRTVKAFSTEGTESLKHEAKNKEVHDLGVAMAKYQAAFSFFLMFFLNASMAGIIFYGSVLYEEGEITVGAISAFLLYMIQLLMGFMVFSFVFTNVVKVEGASKTIIDMMRWVPFVNSKGGDKINQEDLSGEIELQDVCFTYPSKKEISILSNVSIKVEKNKVIALVGQSGCGKSTIISLIERFYDPISGRILFNGKDIKDLDP